MIGVQFLKFFERNCVLHHPCIYVLDVHFRAEIEKNDHVLRNTPK